MSGVIGLNAIVTEATSLSKLGERTAVLGVGRREDIETVRTSELTGACRVAPRNW